MCCDTVRSLLGASSKDILLSRCHKIWAECFLHVCNSPVGKEIGPEDVFYRLRMYLFLSSKAELTTLRLNEILWPGHILV